MKKFFALLLVVLMLLPSIVACGETADPTESSKTTESSDTTNSSKPGTTDSSDKGTTSSSDTGTTSSSDRTNNSTDGETTNSSKVDGTASSVGGGTTGSSDNGGTTSSSTVPTPPVTDEEDVIPAVETKWNGKTLNILATVWTGDTPSAPWSQVELTVGEDDYYSTAGFGQIINSAVCQREDEIKELYGVDLNWINARGAQIGTLISEAIVGGSESTKYHIAMPRMMEAQTIVSGNGIYNLADQRYITLSNSYYNQASVESYTVYGRTLFVAGDFSFLDEQTSYLTYYNIAMTTGIKDFPDLYQMVKDGKWTIDQMTHVAMLVKKNEGDAAWTDDDTYGFGTTTLSQFFQYSGIKQVSVVESELGGNEYALSLQDPLVSTLIDKILVITGSDWARTSWDGGFGALQDAFVDGRLLFYDEVIQKSDYFTNQTDEFKVGILPTPKLSEKQDTYYTPCSYQSVVMCIPKATDDREMSNYFFEILSYTGQKYIMSAFKDNLRSKLDPDKANESMEIIENYIFANLCYDQGYMSGWEGLLNSVQYESYSSGKNNFTSAYNDAKEDALLQVSTWNDNWLYSDDSVGNN